MTLDTSMIVIMAFYVILTCHSRDRSTRLFPMGSTLSPALLVLLGMSPVKFTHFQFKMLIMKVYEPLKWACYYSMECQINRELLSEQHWQQFRSLAFLESSRSLAYAQQFQDAWTFADRVTQCGFNNWSGYAGMVYPTTFGTDGRKGPVTRCF